MEGLKMNRILSAVAVMSIIAISFAAIGIVFASSTITSGNSALAPMQEHIWGPVNGLYWLFYYDGTHYNYATCSAVGVCSWSSPTAIQTAASGINDMGYWVSGTTVYYVGSQNSAASKAFYFRTGTLGAGVINWHGSETSVSTPYAYVNGVSLVNDSYGNVWASARVYDGTHYHYLVYYKTSSRWTLSADLSGYLSGFLVPLTGGKMAIVYISEVRLGFMGTCSGIGCNTWTQAATNSTLKLSQISGTHLGDTVQYCSGYVSNSILYITYVTYNYGATSFVSKVVASLSEPSTGSIDCAITTDGVSNIGIVYTAEGALSTTAYVTSNDGGATWNTPIAIQTDAPYSQHQNVPPTSVNSFPLIWNNNANAPFVINFQVLSYSTSSSSSTSIQPLTVTVLETGAPTGTYTVNGCSPNSTTGSTGTTTNFTMASSCPFTISFTNSGSVRWGFISGGVFSATSGILGPTCSSGTCSTISVNADYQVPLTVNGGNGVTYSVPSETSDGWYKYGDSLTVSSNGIWSRSSGTGTRLASWNLDGGPNTNISQTSTFTTTAITMTAARTVNFNQVAQYQTTLINSPIGGGSSVATTNPAITGDTGWYDSGTSVSVSATANSGYNFSSWSGTGSGQYTGPSNPATVTVSAAITETAFFSSGASVTQPLNVSVLEPGAPTGETYTVNGCSPSPTTGTTGSTTSFTMTSSCSFTISFANSGMVRWGFITSGSFSSTSAAQTTCGSGTCSTVAFNVDYQLRLTANGGSGVSYSLASETSDGWYKYGDSLTASTNSTWSRVSGTGTRLSSWNLDGGSNTSITQTTTYTTSPITMTATHTVNFNSVTQYQLTLNTAATSALVSCTAPTIPGDNYWYDAGTASVACTLNGVYGRGSGTGTRVPSYNWDGGSGTAEATTGTFTTSSVTMSATHQVNANAVTQYQIMVTAGTGGTASATTSPTISGDTGWYDVNTVVSFTATPNYGYTFSAWTGTGAGSYSGTNNPASVTLTAYVTETTAFTTTAKVALDGSGSSSCSSSTLTSCTVRLTTSKSNDVIMLYVYRATGSKSYTITDTAGLAWHTRSISGSPPAAFTVYYAIATSALSSDTIKASLSSSPETLQMIAFGVSGANTTSPFDSGASGECYNHGTVTAGKTISCSITTNHANDLVIGFAEEVQAGGLTAGSTLIKSSTASGIGAAEYSIVTSSGSQVISWTNSATSSQSMYVTGDAIIAG